MELLFLGRAFERGGRQFAARNHTRQFVEISGADLVLVLRRGVALRLGGKLLLLQFGIRGHAPFAITARELEHAEIKRVESGEGDELKLVTHCAKLALKFCY